MISDQFLECHGCLAPGVAARVGDFLRVPHGWLTSSDGRTVCSLECAELLEVGAGLGPPPGDTLGSEESPGEETPAGATAPAAAPAAAPRAAVIIDGGGGTMTAHVDEGSDLNAALAAVLGDAPALTSATHTTATESPMAPPPAPPAAPAAEASP